MPMKNPPHPGLSVRCDCLDPLGISIWIASCVLCVGAAKSFQKIADHPKSVEKIDKKITKLREKLLPNRDNEKRD